jgi:hypothetical protein
MAQAEQRAARVHGEAVIATIGASESQEERHLPNASVIMMK